MAQPVEQQQGEDPLSALVRQQGFAVVDGGLATELEARGADLGSDLWSARLLLDAPDLVQAAHRAYYDAGADICITASYQASFQGFKALGLDEPAAQELMTASVRLAQQARDGFCAAAATAAPPPRARFRPLVAASVGSYGAFLADGSEYTGRYGAEMTEEALADWHRPRLRALAAARPDLLACETVPCIAEARALARLASELAEEAATAAATAAAATHAPPTPPPPPSAWISVSCADGAQLCSREALAGLYAAVDAADTHGAVVALGVNCTAPAHAAAAIRTLRAAADAAAAAEGGGGERRRRRRLVVAYPNAGEAWDGVAKQWVEGTGEAAFGDLARVWRAAGADAIGGCCRVGPTAITAVRAALERGADAEQQG